jgi:hypothetical protein
MNIDPSKPWSEYKPGEIVVWKNWAPKRVEGEHHTYFANQELKQTWDALHDGTKPWLQEPDYVMWLDSETGYLCIVFRVANSGELALRVFAKSTEKVLRRVFEKIVLDSTAIQTAPFPPEHRLDYVPGWDPEYQPRPLYSEMILTPPDFSAAEYCIYGSGTPTIEQEFFKCWPNKEPAIQIHCGFHYVSLGDALPGAQGTRTSTGLYRPLPLAMAQAALIAEQLQSLIMAEEASATIEVADREVDSVEARTSKGRRRKAKDSSPQAAG